MQAKGFISEFRDFIFRGNVMDMAVGVLMRVRFLALYGHCTSKLQELQMETETKAAC